MRRDELTGLILAGGQGRRMGGVDKALVHHAGLPLMVHVLQRLAPQVRSVQVVTAQGRVLPGFEDAGLDWLPDALPDYQGPMAGMLAGLQACPTPWLLTAPCDAPRLPPDLGAHLAGALAASGGRAAVACTRTGETLRLEPMFTLLHIDLAPSLAASLAAGERAMQRWLQTPEVAALPVVFAEATGFFNANTPQDLLPSPQGTERRPPLSGPCR